MDTPRRSGHLRFFSESFALPWVRQSPRKAPDESSSPGSPPSHNSESRRLTGAGHQSLDKVQQLLYQNRQILITNVPEFDSRWEKLYSVAPRPGKLAKGRMRPSAFDFQSKALLQDVEAAVLRSSMLQAKERVAPPTPPSVIDSRTGLITPPKERHAIERVTSSHRRRETTDSQRQAVATGSTDVRLPQFTNKPEGGAVELYRSKATRYLPPGRSSAQHREDEGTSRRDKNTPRESDKYKDSSKHHGRHESEHSSARRSNKRRSHSQLRTPRRSHRSQDRSPRSGAGHRSDRSRRSISPDRQDRDRDRDRNRDEYRRRPRRLESLDTLTGIPRRHAEKVRASEARQPQAPPSISRPPTLVPYPPSVAGVQPRTRHRDRSRSVEKSRSSRGERAPRAESRSSHVLKLSGPEVSRGSGSVEKTKPSRHERTPRSETDSSRARPTNPQLLSGQSPTKPEFRLESRFREHLD